MSSAWMLKTTSWLRHFLEWWIAKTGTIGNQESFRTRKEHWTSSNATRLRQHSFSLDGLLINSHSSCVKFIQKDMNWHAIAIGTVRSIRSALTNFVPTQEQRFTQSKTPPA